MIFGQPPKAGESFTIDGKVLVCDGSRPHKTRDDRDIVLIDWRSDCGQCGAEYKFSTTLDTQRRRKRCEACVKAQPKWNPVKLTPEQKKLRAVKSAARRANISSSLKAYHDRRLGRNEIQSD